MNVAPGRFTALDWQKEAVSIRLSDEIMPELLQISDGATSRTRMKLIGWNQRSAIFRCDILDKTYAIKVFGPRSPRKHSAETAFAALKALHERDPEQAVLAVPRPVAASAVFDTLVTDWIDVPTVATYLLSGPPTATLDAVRTAAAWLAALHGSFGGVDDGTDPDFALAKLLRNIPEPGPRTDPRDLPRIGHYRERLVELFDARRDAVQPDVMLHGDPTCANFCYDGQRAIGLDLYLNERGDPAYDYATLLISAEMALGRFNWEKSPWMISRSILRAVLARPELQWDDDFFARLRINLLAYGIRLLVLNIDRECDWSRSCLLSIISGTALNALHSEDL